MEVWCGGGMKVRQVRVSGRGRCGGEVCEDGDGGGYGGVVWRVVWRWDV